MTKDELLEDVKVGDIVKLYTASDEVFEGKIIDLGESGLKISMLNSNKSKRIMYGRITEYDIEELDECAATVVSSADAVKNVDLVHNSDCNVDIMEEPKNSIEEPKMIVEEKREIVLERKDIFKTVSNIDLGVIKNEWIKKLDSKQKNEYVRISNILDYARKIHEFSLNSDRVKRAIAEYKKIAIDVKIMNIFIALIYHEFDEVRTALNFYHEAGAYDVEFQLSLRYGYNEDLFEKAILAVEHNSENEIVIKWLCEYAVKNNDFAVISYVINHSNDNLGKVLLFWYMDKPEIQLIPDKDNIFANANIIYLKNLKRISGDEKDTHIKMILSNVSNVSENTENCEQTKEKIVYNGTISYYNKKGGNGMIKNLEGGSIYFYIKQVKDLELQRILMTETNYKRKVTYIRGVNLKGEIAADAIELDEEDFEEISETEYKYNGFLDDYDIDRRSGKIRSGSQSFNFIFDAIKDPLLYAEIMSRPYSVLDLAVKFNAKDHKSKKTKKTSRVAFDICGTKTYSQEEIDEFISERHVSKVEVNEWLGVSDKTYAGYFKEVAYEPLREIGLVTKEEVIPEKSLAQSGLREKKYIEFRSGEKNAVSILLDSKDKNPFANLKRDSSGKKYFQEAHGYMVGRKNSRGDTIGVDLEKAERLFIQSIRAMDQTNSSVANLVNIYIKQGGEYIVKGLQLLEEYGYLFPPEKLTNLRIQLIDKSGNFEALEQILLSAIPNCVKKNTVWQYMAKLAGLYYKQQKWNDAIEWFEKSISYLDKNKSEFAQYQLLRNNNLRPLIMARYTVGNREEAIIQARKFLLLVPGDLVIKSIVDGTFEINKTKTILEDIEDIELQYEDDLFDVGNSDMSLYLNDKVQKVDLSSTFSKVPIVYEKLQGGRYIGNADDSNKAVKYINDNLLRNKRGISAEVRSAIFIGIARIIYDSRENSSSSNEDKVALDEVKQYVAKYARYSADALVEKYSIVDSIRFLYIQALRYLGETDNGNITVSINMLVASFFMDSTKLPDELHDIMGNSAYNDSYYKRNCVSTKDLLIASFMLQDKQNYVTKILQKIYNEPALRLQVITSLNRMLGEDKNVSEYYDFDMIWKEAKGLYYSNLRQLGKEISDSIKEYHMGESVRIHTQRIQEILNTKLLWNQDEAIIENYLKLIALIGDTFEKYTVEEKIEGFRMAEERITKLKGDIESAPTEFSYDQVYSQLDELRVSIRSHFDDLYQSSRPECSIFLSNKTVYVNEKLAEIAITFSNSDDKQDAEAVEITIEGSAGATFSRCEKKFTSVRSGEKQDYLAVFSLDDKIISEGQFEITVFMHYKYRDSVEKIKTTLISEILPVNITDKRNFVRIDNKYNRIIRGSGVDIKTPELFKGRNELIDSICASMSSADGIMTKNRGIILWGQRRVGKNSVKDYLKEKIRTEYPDAYIIIELGSIGKCRNLREVLITIINKTEDTLMTEYEDIYEKLLETGMKFSGEALEETNNYMPEFSRFMDRLSTRLKKISNAEKNIPLFFLDEFSYLYEWIEKGEIEGKEFMRFWKSFIQDYGICSIIIAQDNIPVWKSRYENEFACMNHDNEITYLDYDGTKELICEPCQIDKKMLFTLEAVQLIYDWTKGSAYLIVIFCKHIIDYLNDNYTEKATKTIVQLVFEKEFIERKEMFRSDDFEPQIQDVANVGQEGDMINHLNKELLKEIASATITSAQVRIDELRFFDLHGEKAQKVFIRLKERKIIEVERNTYCSISMPLLKFYLLREQSLLDKEVLNKMIR